MMHPRITRRHFLQTLAAASLAPPLSWAGGPGKKRVLVIGAGMAGIAAARRLQESGHASVIVLEARDRIGGRIHTEHRADGTVRERGANWLHEGRTNPLVPIAEKLR